MNLHNTIESNLDLDDILKSCEESGYFKDLKIPKKIQTQDPSLQNFQEINDFFEEHGREPQPNALGKEKSLYVRLNAMRKNPSKDLLDLDTHNLLKPSITTSSIDEKPPLNTTISTFNSLDDIFSSEDFTQNISLEDFDANSLFTPITPPTLKVSDSQNLELIETDIELEDDSFERIKCEDFWRYEAYLNKIQEDINTNSKNISTKKYSGQKINVGDLFIYDGVLCFVADRTEVRRKNGKENYRLRVIFANGLEIKVLMLSLAAMLRRSDLNKKISLNEPKEIERRVKKDFSDLVTGYIYIVKLKNTPERLAGYPDLYKVGFTTTTVHQRIMNCENDPAFLEEKVECVQYYECSGNINPKTLETIIHAFLSQQRLTIKLKSKTGKIYSPQEWFDVEYDTINEIVSRTVDGSISNYRMNNTTGRLVLK